jgi:hypothetical protein
MDKYNKYRLTFNHEKVAQILNDISITYFVVYKQTLAHSWHIARAVLFFLTDINYVINISKTKKDHLNTQRTFSHHSV